MLIQARSNNSKNNNKNNNNNNFIYIAPLKTEFTNTLYREKAKQMDNGKIQNKEQQTD